MTGERPRVVFDCPHCHEPFVSVANVEIDIHGGASYECDACERWVVFETFTTEEYREYCEWRYPLARGGSILQAKLFKTLAVVAVVGAVLFAIGIAI